MRAEQKQAIRLFVLTLPLRILFGICLFICLLRTDPFFLDLTNLFLCLLFFFSLLFALCVFFLSDSEDFNTFVRKQQRREYWKRVLAESKNVGGRI